jgi:hypothetical protein
MYKLYLTVILIFHLVMLSFAGTADRSQPKPPSRSTPEFPGLRTDR